MCLRRSTYEEKLCRLERTLDNAVAAALTPSNINTDSILSVPDQLFASSLRFRSHSELCPDHTLAELYSRGPTPITIDRATDADRLDSVTPTAGLRSDRDTPVVTDTESRYSYVPLRNIAPSSLSGARNRMPTASHCNTDTSDIIRELGLDNTETSPPRWYNPPPEKLDPSPDRRPHPTSTDGSRHSKTLSLSTVTSKR